MDTKNCELCGTPLEIDVGGQRFQFQRHSDEWCRETTKWRIAELEHAARVGAAEQHIFNVARAQLAAVYREACELRQRFFEGRAGLPGIAHLDDLQPLFDAVDATRDGVASRERTPPPTTAIPGPGRVL